MTNAISHSRRLYRPAVLAFLILTYLLSFEATSKPAQTLQLTIKEAVQIALARNPGIQAALSRLRQSKEQEQLASLPARLQGTMIIKRQEEQTAKGPPFTTSLGPVKIPIQAQPLKYGTSLFAIQVRQLIYDGGKTAARIEQARKSTESTAYLLIAQYNTLALKVKSAYLDLLSTQHQHKELKLRLQNALQTLKKAQARYRAGDVARADTIYAQLPVSQARLALLRHKNSLKVYQAKLNKLLGLPQDTRLELQEIPSPVVPDLSLDQCLQLALQQRPELIARRKELSAARASVLAAERDNNLDLYAVGELSSTGYNGEVIPVSEGWKLALELRWPILDGGRSEHLMNQAQAVESEKQALLNEATAQVQFEVRQAYLNLHTALEAYQAAQTALKEAEESLKMARGQYEAGVVTILRVNKAQEDLYAARSELHTAKYAISRSLARLEWAIGTHPLPTDHILQPHYK